MWPVIFSAVCATVVWIRSHDWQLGVAVLIVVGSIMLTEMRVRSIEAKIKEMRLR